MQPKHLYFFLLRFMLFVGYWHCLYNQPRLLITIRHEHCYSFIFKFVFIFIFVVIANIIAVDFDHSDFLSLLHSPTLSTINLIPAVLVDNTHHFNSRTLPLTPHYIVPSIVPSLHHLIISTLAPIINDNYARYFLSNRISPLDSLFATIITIPKLTN